MTLEATPIQPAQDAGRHFPPLPDDGTDLAARGSPPQSRLSHCIAWLFGLEALLRDRPVDRDDYQRRD